MTFKLISRFQDLDFKRNEKELAFIQNYKTKEFNYSISVYFNETGVDQNTRNLHYVYYFVVIFVLFIKR